MSWQKSEVIGEVKVRLYCRRCGVETAGVRPVKNRPEPQGWQEEGRYIPIYPPRGWGLDPMSLQDEWDYDEEAEEYSWGCLCRACSASPKEHRL